jgi:hypothetical protein
MEHLPDPKSGENVNSTTFVRRALRPFANLCKARQVAGLISTHPPKSKGSTFADMVIASAAFVHMCRVGLLFAWHPDDLDLDEGDRRRVLMRPPGGSNIGRNPGTFEFRVAVEKLAIEGELEEVPYTTPLTPSDVTFRDLTRTPRDDPPVRPKIAEAKREPSPPRPSDASRFDRARTRRATARTVVVRLEVLGPEHHQAVRPVWRSSAS